MLSNAYDHIAIFVAALRKPILAWTEAAEDTHGGHQQDAIQSPVLGAVLFALATMFLLHRLYVSHCIQLRKRDFFIFAASHGCGPPKTLPRRFLSGLRHKLSLLNNKGRDLLDDVFAQKYRHYGATHVLLGGNGLPKAIHTTDPANLNAMMVTSARDWRPAQGRINTLYPLAQEGLLLTEGALWQHNRKLIQRLIGVQRARDVHRIDRDIELLFEAIGPAQSDGWTEEVDLLDLFHHLALDASTAFLLGNCANAQASYIQKKARQAAIAEFGLKLEKPNKEMSIDEAYEIIRDYFSWRAKLGSKYWLADSFKYRTACATLVRFADNLIVEAVHHCKDMSEEDLKLSDDGYGMIAGMARELGDPVKIRNLAMDLFIAGQNMTGTMAAWAFACLERHPDVFGRLRTEVFAKFGTEDDPLAPMTWNNLRACTTLQHVIMETMRMFPLIANVGRNAKCDTVLPRGGGSDGLQPIAVPKGAAVVCNVYLMHRREQEWGHDALEWKPDRWAGRRYGPEYSPFGAGPRVCIGQQLSMTEISVLIARMCQRFSAIKAPEGQDNLTKGYRAILSPKNGVKVRLQRAQTKKRPAFARSVSVR